LVALYKTEPKNKKIYEMLSNDFTQPRWQKVADKNAMVLLSKKNYNLALTFFILAGKIKDAVRVSIDRMGDLMMALFICRMIEGDDGPIEKEITQQYLIDEGKLANDPWMINLGLWKNKEYLESINQIRLKGKSTTNCERILKDNDYQFELFGESSKEGSKLAANNQRKKKYEAPLYTNYNYSLIDLVESLKKHHLVKRELNKDWKLDDGGGAGGPESIFDDFFGGPVVKKKEEKKVGTLNIDEEKLVTEIIFDYLKRGYSLISFLTYL
jgi:hypothetical protein